MSTAYSDIIREYSRPLTSHSLQSISSHNLFLERPSTVICLERNATELQSGSEIALANDQSNQQPESPPPTDLSFTVSEMFFIVTVCLFQFLSLAGLAQTFAPLMILSDVFNVGNPGVMTWPTAAYSLTLGSCILPAGGLGDMFGHRKILLSGWIFFAVTSLLCGFSALGGSPMFTACRAAQGIGPALLIPNGLALFGRTFPVGMKRNIAISLFGGSGPCGVVTGAVMSSLLSELAWWPWSFWSMGIACFFVATLTYAAVPEDSARLCADAGGWKAFDLYGALTGVGGLILVNFALNQAPIAGWTTVYISVLLAVGALFICCFVYIELRVAETPLIPIKGLRMDSALTLACIAAGWGSHGVWSYYMFLLIEQFRDHSALEACSMFWPVAPIGLAAALSVGFLLKRINVAYLMSISMLCFLLGCIFLATAPGEQSYFPNTFLSIAVAPFGMNWSFPTAVILMSNAVPREHQGIAASLVSTVVNYSISTGLGFAGSIDGYIGHEYGLLAGYRGAWYFGIGLSALGFLISLYFIWQSRKSRSYG
jgi:MFS family permease